MVISVSHFVSIITSIISLPCSFKMLTTKRLIAHRGMSSLAPENTLAAFSLCKAHNIQWFECDIDILRDGTIIVSHDDTLDRCTDKRGQLYNISHDDIANIDAGSWFADQFIGEKLPTLEELIALANTLELNMNIEIKSCAASPELSYTLIDNLIVGLKNLDPERELIVSSFNHLALTEFKRRSPETQVACLFESHNLWDNWNSILDWCNADYIHPQDKGLTQEMVHKFKAAGFKVNVWTVNDHARANQLFNWGVDGICTDIAHEFTIQSIS